MRRSQIPHDVFFTPAGGAATVQSAAVEDVRDDGAEVTAPPAPPPEPEPPRTEKLQISVYIEPATARLLDEMRFSLQYEHGCKTSKSALVDYAIRKVSADIENLVAAAEAGELDRG